MARRYKTRAAFEIVSALPGAPDDGEVCFFQDAGMATAGVVWQFRYRAAGGTSKWEFVGGPPLVSEVDAAENLSLATYSALATPGPSLTTPLAGDYLLTYSATIYPAVTGTATGGRVSFDIGATGAVDADAIYVGLPTANDGTSAARTRRKNALAAGTALVLKYRNAAVAPAIGYSARVLNLIPIRVG